jgi:hypothetical protein
MEVIIALWLLWLPIGLLKLIVEIIKLRENKKNTN